MFRQPRSREGSAVGGGRIREGESPTRRTRARGVGLPPDLDRPSAPRTLRPSRAGGGGGRGGRARSHRPPPRGTRPPRGQPRRPRRPCLQRGAVLSGSPAAGNTDRPAQERSARRRAWRRIFRRGRGPPGTERALRKPPPRTGIDADRGHDRVGCPLLRRGRLPSARHGPGRAHPSPSSPCPCGRSYWPSPTSLSPPGGPTAVLPKRGRPAGATGPRRRSRRPRAGGGGSRRKR